MKNLNVGTNYRDSGLVQWMFAAVDVWIKLKSNIQNHNSPAVLIKMDNSSHWIRLLNSIAPRL